MKKLVFMFVAIAAMSFASCGNKNQSAAPATDSDTTVVADTADSAAAPADSAAAPADTTAAQAK